jgi:hypothetical protein
VKCGLWERLAGANNRKEAVRYEEAVGWAKRSVPNVPLVLGTSLSLLCPTYPLYHSLLLNFLLFTFSIFPCISVANSFYLPNAKPPTQATAVV